MQAALPIVTLGRWPHIAPGSGATLVPCSASPLSPCLLLSRSAFDLVNIHLFHDASNLVAWETSPSVYSGIRHKALGYVLDRWVLRVRPLPPHLLQGRGSLSFKPLVHVCCFPIGQNTKFANVAPNPSPGPKA